MGLRLSDGSAVARGGVPWRPVTGGLSARAGRAPRDPR